MQIKTKPGRRPTRSVVLHCRYHCYYNKQHKNLQHFLSNFVTSGRKKRRGSGGVSVFRAGGLPQSAEFASVCKKREICHKLLKISIAVRALGVYNISMARNKPRKLKKAASERFRLSGADGNVESGADGNEESGADVNGESGADVNGGKINFNASDASDMRGKEKTTKHTGNTALFLS